MAESSAWKQVYDRLDSTVGSRLNEFARSEDFATVVALGRRVQRDLVARGEHSTRRLLHSLNLPAGSDVNRLLRQIGNLEREVRELRKQIADATPERRIASKREVGHASPVRNGGRSRAAAS